MEWQRISDDEVIFADAWLKNKVEGTTSLPDNAHFACAYEVGLADPVFDFFYQAALLHRTETADELWIGYRDPLANGGLGYGIAFAKDFEPANLESIGRVFAIKRKGEELTACLRLMWLFFRVRHGFEWPEQFVAPGIVDKSAYDDLCGRLENEYEENRRKAKENETELVKVARELGLSPFPPEDYPDQWQAYCPGRNHPIYITTTGNYFFCGWCRRKGGIEELRAFVEERRKL